MKKTIIVVSLLFFHWQAFGYKLPSSLSVSQRFDNDRNRETALDFTYGTPFYAMVNVGIARSHLQFDDEETGENRSYIFGISSNPLRDWVFAYDFSYIDVSDQMTILDPSISILKYFKKFDLKLNIGYRTIKTDISDLLQTLRPSLGEEIQDDNFWWRLSTNINITPKIVLGLSYQQFQYSTRFDFFTLPIAETLGYTFDTLNYGASFADYIYSVNGSFYRNRWDFALDYTFVSNEFDDTQTYTWTPSVGFHLNKSWYFYMNIGFSRGVTPDEEDVTGGFFGLGTTFSF